MNDEERNVMSAGGGVRGSRGVVVVKRGWMRSNLSGFLMV